jgi:hypothetical protein
MKKLLLLSILLNIMVLNLVSQDTIIVQTLTFDSITTRRGIWEFPTGETFRKILMVHTLKCDPLTTWDQYPCGEWDYLTYNMIYRHTGMYDSTLYYHPSFTFANERTTDSVLLRNSPVYNYFNHRHSNVNYIDTLSLLDAEVGYPDEYTFEVFPAPNHSGRSQYLWKAEELTTQNFTEGFITGIKIYSLMFSSDLAHVMVRIGQTDLEELSPGNPVIELDTIFYNVVNFVAEGYNDLNFSEPFYWDGTSNIIIDFSFTDPTVEGTVNLFGNDPGFNCGISSGSNNYALDLDGETDFLKLPPDIYYNSDFTFETWLYKRNNNNWSRIFDFGNGPNMQNVIVALSSGTDGHLSFHVYNDGWNKSFSLDNATALNHWTHLTIRLTGHIAWVYINGEQVKLGLLQQPQDTIRSIDYIGRSNWSSDDFADVLLDEFRIYKTALDPDTILAHYRQGIENPVSDTSLIVYYTFDEGEGMPVLDHSSYGHHPAAYGLPNHYPIQGSEIYMGFHQSNIRPMITFERLVSSGNLVEYVDVTDSIADSQLQIILFGNPNEPTVPTDTVYYWKAGKRYVYKNWQVVDSVWIEPDEVLYKEDLPYYSEPFEVIDPFEIGRFITPYGINLSLGPQGFSWVFDVTDYSPLLQGQVDLSAGNTQELIDLKFIMIKGTPPRDVLQIDKVWDGLVSYYYKDLDDDIVLQEKTVDLLPEASQFRVKTRLTGHGEQSSNGEYPHCCEWKDNEHYLMVNGEQVDAWHIFQYHDCGLNPVFPQGGTWPGAREGWCPGDMVTDHDFEITNYITGEELTLDYDLTPVPPDNLGMGWGNYVVNMDLIQYKESNFDIDAEIYDLVTPSIADYYSRKNPVCYDPEILLRNNGKNDLTSLNIEYSMSGGIVQNYTWTGLIEPHCTDTVVLPVTFSSFWLGDSLHIFTTRLSEPNGMPDEYSDNDIFVTPINMPDFYNEPFIIQLKTNNQAYRYSMEVRDVLGNVLISRNNLENNTVYRDTINFTDGCYTLELLDQEDMGLSYWAYPEQGYGYLRFFDHDSVMIKNFNSDFGRSIFYTFSLGDVSYIAEPALDEIVKIYPNPFTDEVRIDFEEYCEYADIAVYSIQGQKIYSQHYNPCKDNRLKLDLSDKPAGLYIVQVRYGNFEVKKKIIKK